MPFLHHEYLENVKWIDMARAKRLRWKCAHVSRVQLKRLPNVFRLRIDLAKRRSLVCKRHASTCRSLQTPEAIRKVLVPLRAGPPGLKSD